jgi:hypothetical protein
LQKLRRRLEVALTPALSRRRARGILGTYTISGRGSAVGRMTRRRGDMVPNNSFSRLREKARMRGSLTPDPAGAREKVHIPLVRGAHEPP